MNFKVVLRTLGILLVSEAVCMLPALLTAFIYKGDDASAFIYSILVLILIGVPLLMLKPQSQSIYARDGFAIVAIGWVLMSFFGALPFVISGAIPSFIDAFFEASSGFTTTGASILKAVEGLPKGILFWRSFTHWIGGMGVLVLTLAVLPSVSAGNFQIMKAESPGPTPGKLVPRVGETAKILYGIYIIFTVVEVILLRLTGMPLFDSLLNTFGTVGTGGFGILNTSIAGYNNVWAEIVITIFMLICGANFALYYYMIKGDFKSFFKDGEFKFYIGIVTASIILIAINLYGNIFESVGQSLRHSSFQVASIITTTGYASTDFEQWPMLSKAVLFILMFIGGCAGSTSGGLKSIRILLMIKITFRELLQIIHPRGVYTVKFAGKSVEEKTLSEVLAFFFMYMLIFIMAFLVISTDGKDMVTTITSVAATLGNVGPGFGMVGPMGNFSEWSDLSKIVLSFCMITGRLEIYPILLLMVPSFWKRVNI